MANYTKQSCYQFLTENALPLATNAIVSLAGLLIQFFIVSPNVTDWLKGRPRMVADQIITSLGITRILLHISCIPCYLSICITDINSVCFFFIFITSFYSNIWLSALLSFFFCFKISTFHNVFFLRLKTILSQRVTCLIIVCVLLSFGYSAVDFLFISLPFLRYTPSKQMFESLYVLWNVLPFLVFFISSVLLIISISVHLRRMKNGSNVMSSTGTYYKTIVYALVSFLTCSLSIIENLIDTFHFELFGFKWMLFCINISPILHSVLLICVTTKLKNQFYRMVRCGFDCLFNSEAPEPDSRGPVEMTPM